MTVGTNETYRFACRVSGDDAQDVMNVWFIETTFSTTETDGDFVDAVLQRLKNAYSVFNDYQSLNYDVIDVKVDQVSWVTDKIVIDRNVGTYSWPAGYSPGEGGDALPSGAAFLIKFRTGGVRTLVRKFFSGIVETHFTAGGFSAAMLTACLAAFDDFIVESAVSGTNYIDFVVHSLRSGNWETYLECVVSAVAAYQRRRRLGTGS